MMLAPRSRLLLWTAGTIVPLSLLITVSPEAAPPCLVVMAFFGVIVLADILFGLGKLDGIAVELPAVVRMSKDREGVIAVEVRNERQTSMTLRMGLAVPGELGSQSEDMTAQLPAGSLLSRLQWQCRPVKRGNYVVDRCYVEGASRLGFWSFRGCLPVKSEIRVYPNLFDGRRAAAALFLNRGNFGEHAQRQVGKGRDFEKVREYQPGDSYDEIHWKATAKRNRPVTKVFQIERTQEVYVVIDASRLSAREPERAGAASVENRSENSVLERFITAGLLLGAAAGQQGDLFGLLAFDDKVRSFVRAKNGKAHYSACRDALYTLHPRVVTPDFDEVFSFIRLRLRRRALLVFLTSLDDPVLAESFVHNMNLICRQHLVLVNMMTPPGVAPLFSEPDVSATDHVYQRLGGHLLWSKLRELERSLGRHGVRFSLVGNEKLSPQLITQYLSIKRRQLL